MPTKTWSGSATNNYDDPSAWSPGGVPAPGDIIAMPSGTLNLDANPAGGLILGAANTTTAATINFTQPNVTATVKIVPYAEETLTVNAAHDSTIALSNAYPSSARETVNIPQGDTLHATFFGLNFGSLTVAGDNATLVNDGPILIDGSTAAFNVNVTGAGTITSGSAQSIAGSVEFLHGVASGQTVIAGGDPVRGAISKVTIDDLPDYHATTELNASAEVDLHGVAADSYTYQDNVLTLYSGGQQTGTLNLAISPGASSPAYPETLRVSRTNAGVAVDYTASAPPPSYQPLPVFTPPAPPASQPPDSTPPASDGSQTGSTAGSSSGNASTTATPSTATGVGATATGGTSANTPPASANPPPAPITLTPTPISASEQGFINAAGTDANAGAVMTFLVDGGHLAPDFAALGAAITSGADPAAPAQQIVTDLQAWLKAYVAASPAIATGVSVPGGPMIALPPQLAVDFTNVALKGVAIGSAPLDQALGGAYGQFFATEEQVMLSRV
ncbi:MAG TPA: hypothetical protein VJ779_02300 [Acetobacteraceae bacterium]|nr:hypothetical protein [Acetobacteraceae bacterium]